MKLAGIALLLVAGLAAQNFQSASVKRSAPEAGNGAKSTGEIPQQLDPSRINYPGVNLKAVLALAYGVSPDQIAGPKWLGDDRFDIVATLPAGATQEQIPVMLQHLLAQRFGMAVREETKPRTFSALVPAKGGVKMKTVEKPEVSATVDLMSDNIQLNGFTMPAFAKFLTSSMGRPVVDETGLQGSYDITLYLSMADMKSGRARVAIQQLGLTFETRTAPWKSVTVEKANRVPTED